MYLGAAMSPDSNIGGASDEQIIHINDLPFRRDAEELDDVGHRRLGLGQGESINNPLGDRLRLRLGGDVSRQDYGGSKFDQTSASVHAGPRWLVDRDTEVSLVGTARRRWTWHGTLQRRSRGPGRSRAPADPADQGKRAGLVVPP